MGSFLDFQNSRSTTPSSGSFASFQKNKQSGLSPKQKQDDSIGKIVFDMMPDTPTPSYFGSYRTKTTTPAIQLEPDRYLSKGLASVGRISLATGKSFLDFASTLPPGGRKPSDSAIGAGFVAGTPGILSAVQRTSAYGLRELKDLGSFIIGKKKDNIVDDVVAQLNEAADRNDELSRNLQQAFFIDNPDAVVEGLRNKDRAGFVIGSGLASITAPLGAGAVGLLTGGPVGAGAAAFGSAFAIEGGSAINEAKNFLENSDDPELVARANDEDFLTKVGVTVGLVNAVLETIPITKLLSRSNITDPIRKRIIREATERILTQGLLEGSTESVQEIVANTVARAYDENRNLFEGVGESFYGGFVLGGGISGLFDAPTALADLPAGLSIEDVTKRKTILGVTPPTSPAEVREFTGEKRTDSIIQRREKTLLNEKLRNIEKLAASRAAKDVAVAREINKAELKYSKMESKLQLRNLRTGIEERYKALKAGKREGVKMTRKEVKGVQDNIIKILAGSGLSAKDREKFTKTIKNIQSETDFVKELPTIEARIGRLTLEEIVRNKRAEIKKELKTIKPKMVSGKKVGKFTPMIQETLDSIKRVMRMNQDTRTGEIRALKEKQAKGLTPAEQTTLQVLTARQNGDFAGILSLVKKLKEGGRNINELIAFNRFALKEQNVEKAIDVVTGGKPIPERADVNPEENFFDKFKAQVFTTGQSMMHLQSVADVLSSNDKTSTTFNSFLNKLFQFQAQISNEKAAIDNFITEISNKFAEIYSLKRKRDIAKKYRVDSKVEELGEFTDGFGNKRKLNFSKAELRKRYMEFQDESVMKALEANGWTTEMTNAVNKQLSAQDREFANWQLDFYRRYYERINEIYKKIYGVNMPQGENYSPIRRDGFDPSKAEGFGEFLQEPFFRASIAGSSMKARVQSDLRIKEQSDLVVMANYISQMEHFINFAERIQEVRDVSDDPRFQKAVESFYGKKANQIVKGFMDDITSGGMKTAIRNEKLESLMGSMATGVLAIKLSITFKQLTSIPAFAAQMPIKPYVKYALQFWKNPVKNSKFLFDNSVDLRTRGFNVTKNMLELSKTENYKNLISKKMGFADLVSLNIMVGDKGAIVAGGYPIFKYHYDKAKNSGKSEQEAISIGILEFEKAFNLTQQTAHLQGLSAIQRGGIFTRLWTAFLSSPNLYLQYEAAALRGVMTGRMSKAEAAKVIFVFHILLPNLFVLAGNAFDDDKLDEQEHLLASIIGPLTGIFVVGDMVESITRGMLGMKVFENSSPVFRIAGEALDLINTVKDDDPAEVLQILEDVSSLGETIPVVAPGAAITSQTIKAAEGISDILNGDLEDGLGLMFGYTRYSVGKRGPSTKKKRDSKPQSAQERLDALRGGSTSGSQSVEERLKELRR